MGAWHNADGTLDPVKVRAEYPIFKTQPGGRPLHYLDSAATAQRPQRVVDAVSKFLFTANANPHRGAYTLAQMATDGYEAARARIATYLNVPSSELVMLGSATEALNLVARSWGKANLRRGDVVLVTEAEHHANLIPWQQITREMDADLEFIPVDDVTGEILWDRLDTLMKLKPAHGTNSPKHSTY
jgi:cysteine desulfurase/selenocysteine lyase